MDTKYAFPQSAQGLVYVKPVNVSDLPKSVQDEADGRERLYAVHDADGQQLALVADHKMAVVLARQNNLEPVTLH